MNVSHISLPTTTVVTTAVLGYSSILPAELLVVLSNAALQHWR